VLSRRSRCATRRRQSVGDLSRNRDDPLERERPDGKRLAKGLPFNPFHRDPRHVAALSHVVNRYDRGMIQDRCCSRFDLKAAPKGGIGEQFGRDHFERSVASEARIASAVDLSHSSSPEERLDPVRTEEVTRLERHARMRVSPSAMTCASRAS